MIRTLVLGLLLSYVPMSQADWIHRDYADFYRHLRKLNDEELSQLQLAFGFVNVRSKALCSVQHVIIDTPKQKMPMPVIRNRFVLPAENALKLANAKVRIEIAEPANQCDLSVQLEAQHQHYKAQISAADLKLLDQQFSNFFSEMGGLLSFMMPSSQGLVVQFYQDEIASVKQNLAQKAGFSWVEDKLYIQSDWIKSNQSELNLVKKPLRVTALVKK